MRLSHSKLSTILTCPMTYYLSYIEGISKKEEKTAFYVGSAIHWGIEHSTEDLSEYFKIEPSVNKDNYTREMLLSEAVVHTYLKHKDEIFNEILRNNETGEQYTLIDETHELSIEAPLHSSITNVEHTFNGIIDLLLLTNKGFIIIDYKTSSKTPDWSNYLDQIYRYVFMLKSMFPDIPVVKIGIINLKKSNIRQKKNENEIQFLNRLKLEYDVCSEDYINYHEYTSNSLDENLINDYIRNLSQQCDLAYMIDKNKIRFINYSAAKNEYGKSDFWDIFYKTPDCYVLYKIRDHIWNEEIQDFDKCRDCLPMDMQVIENIKVFNHYEYLKEIVETLQSHEKARIFDYIKENYDLYDKDLIEKYVETFNHENKEKIQ